MTQPQVRRRQDVGSWTDSSVKRWERLSRAPRRLTVRGPGRLATQIGVRIDTLDWALSGTPGKYQSDAPVLAKVAREAQDGTQAHNVRCYPAVGDDLAALEFGKVRFRPREVPSRMGFRQPPEPPSPVWSPQSSDCSWSVT
jgi:hypothetical protein